MMTAPAVCRRGPHQGTKASGTDAALARMAISGGECFTIHRLVFVS